PFPRVVVPVRQAVDDQLVPGPVTQPERLDGHPLAVEGLPAAVRSLDRAEPAQDLLERSGPVLLGTEQQPDHVPDHSSVTSGKTTIARRAGTLEAGRLGSWGSWANQ